LTVVQVRGHDRDSGPVHEVQQTSAIRTAAVTHQDLSVLGHKAGAGQLVYEAIKHRKSVAKPQFLPPSARTGPGTLWPPVGEAIQARPNKEMNPHER
jgi:hypothetical protein